MISAAKIVILLRINKFFKKKITILLLFPLKTTVLLIIFYTRFFKIWRDSQDYILIWCCKLSSIILQFNTEESANFCLFYNLNYLWFSSLIRWFLTSSCKMNHTPNISAFFILYSSDIKYSYYVFTFCCILYLVERMSSWVIPIIRCTSLSSIPIS